MEGVAGVEEEDDLLELAGDGGQLLADPGHRVVAGHVQ